MEFCRDHPADWGNRAAARRIAVRPQLLVHLIVRHWPQPAGVELARPANAICHGGEQLAVSRSIFGRRRG